MHKFPKAIVMVTASYPEIIGHSLRVITVRGKTNQRREGVSSQYLNYTVKTPNTDPLSLLIPCWKNQPTAQKKNIKKKVNAQVMYPYITVVEVENTFSFPEDLAGA